MNSDQSLSHGNTVRTAASHRLFSSWISKLIWTTGCIALLLTCTSLPAADWPTYRADYSRSGISTDALKFPLTARWTFHSKHPPQPAWGGEAKEDGYNKVYNLKHRQNFDYAFQVISVGDRLWFGSSADDKVYCLNATNGEEVWAFYTEAPIRLAPTFHNNRIYVGSDDGYAYCLNATDGALIWKSRLGPRDYRIPGHGRIISAWPLRTSLIASSDTIYACAGMFPSEGVYLCALNAEDGKMKWNTLITDLPAQGYMLASASRLYVPTGRNNPIVFDRANGKRLRTVNGAGGTYALLAGNTLVFGPGKTGQLGVVSETQKDQLATFSGNHLIVQPNMSYLHSDTEISALDRQRYIDLVQQRRGLEGKRKAVDQQLKAVKNNNPQATKLKTELSQIGEQLNQNRANMSACIPWKQPCSQSLSLILANDSLIAGGRNEVAAYSTTDGKKTWTGQVSGNAYGLAAANQRLFVSTDNGTIHCFTDQ